MERKEIELPPIKLSDEQSNHFHAIRVHLEHLYPDLVNMESDSELVQQKDDVLTYIFRWKFDPNLYSLIVNFFGDNVIGFAFQPSLFTKNDK